MKTIKKSACFRALLSLFALSVYAVICRAETPDQPSNAQLESKTELVYERMHDKIFSLSDRIDRFFGSARTDEQRQDDYLRVGGEMRVRTASPLRFRERARLSVNLDAVSDRLKLIVEGDDGEQRKHGRGFDDVLQGADRLGDFTNQGTSTGLRYNLLRDSGIDVDVTGGLRFSGGPDPFGKIRFSRRFQLSKDWAIEPSEFLLWYFEDGFGERTRLDIDHDLTEITLLRSRSEALYSETSRGVDLYQEFSITQQITERSYLGVLGSMVAFTEPGYVVDEYRTAFRYRSSFVFPWLYLEFEPALAFPDDRSYRTTPEFIFRIDVYFDRFENKPTF